MSATTDFPMQPHEAALGAADDALIALWRHADTNRGPDGSINVSTYSMAKAVIAAVEPILRADERAKVAEEIATAIEDTKPSSAHFWDTADTATVYALNRAAAIARTCVVHMPGAVQEGAEPPDAYPSEGGADSDAHKPAQPDKPASAT